MPRNYYCLVASLPNISLEDSKLSYDSKKFREDLTRDLHKSDLSIFDYFLAGKDNKNFLTFLTGKADPFIEGGSLSEEELKNKIENPADLPVYLQEFIAAFKTENAVIPENPELYLNSLYYDYLLKSPNKFLREWFEFELNLRNIFTAFNCRKYGIEIKNEIVGSNWIAESIRVNSTRDFGLNELPYMNQLLQIYEGSSLMDREKAVDLMRWDMLDEMIREYYFSVERLFSYYWKIAVVERWLGLDLETGRKMFNKLIDDLKKTYEFPEEFK